MATVPMTCRVAIEAPDGAAALELERRLWHLSPAAVSHRGMWIVDVPAAPDPDELESVVRHWLEDVGADSSMMLVDGEARVVRSARR